MTDSIKEECIQERQDGSRMTFRLGRSCDSLKRIVLVPSRQTGLFGGYPLPPPLLRAHEETWCRIWAEDNKVFENDKERGEYDHREASWVRWHSHAGRHHMIHSYGSRDPRNTELSNLGPLKSANCMNKSVCVGFSPGIK